MSNGSEIKQVVERLVEQDMGNIDFGDELPNVPRDTLFHMNQYITHRVPPGGFLRAVFENNLVSAIRKADAHNRRALVDIVDWVFNNAPYDCWGSPEKVQAWLVRR